MATLADREQQLANAALIERLISRRHLTLRGQARRHGAGPDQVEDILQRSYELFIERYAPPYEPLAWLMTTIKREAWAEARRPHRRHELPISTKDETGERGYDLAQCIPDPGRQPSEIAAERDRDAQIRRHLRALKPDQRTALGLLAFGFSYREIARLQDWTYTKVNRCLSEGRARLHETLETDGSGRQ
jgi:RNA polymerase sigma factor (sigma-70 family)